MHELGGIFSFQAKKARRARERTERASWSTFRIATKIYQILNNWDTYLKFLIDIAEIMNTNDEETDEKGNCKVTF